MKMIELSCSCYVAADEISEITVNDGSGTITVRLKNGIGHSVTNDYGKGIYETCRRLINEVNEALKIKEQE